MEIRAKLNDLRIAPRKVRLVAGFIKGGNAEKALNLLRFTQRKAAMPMKKLLDSAIANAKNNFKLSEEELFISKIFVDEGATLKRWMPRSRGRSMSIHKKTSHITIILSGDKKMTKDEKDNDLKKDSLKKKAIKTVKKSDSGKDKKRQKAGGTSATKIFRRKSF